MSHLTCTIVAIMGAVVGNFIYQAITNASWDIAIERSWFQVIALITVHLIWTLSRRKSP